MDAVLAKYLDIRAPRYTSYPTAPHFSGQIGENDMRKWLAELPEQKPLSLYLHVPFCRKMCWYCGCNMKLAARYDPIARYVDHLIREIDLVAKALPRRMTVSHIHWGGGTPTTLSPADFRRVDATLRDGFDIAPDAEIAVEIDPRTLSEETAATLGAIGCNRASLGVQEFHPTVQTAINRVQPFEMVAEVTGALRQNGIRAINFDLMYGLPHQTQEMLLATIKRAEELQPDRIALFGYAHVPWMAKNQRMIPEDTLPDAAARFETAEAAADLLERLGYQRIGIDHFAHPDDALALAAHTGHLRRNFQGYTTDVADALIGLGASAISALPQGYAQNSTETGAYMREIRTGRLAIAKGIALNDEDRLRREVIERLMCDFAVDLQAVCAEFGFPPSYLQSSLDRLSPYMADSLITTEQNRITITARGKPAARLIAAGFDAYLGERKTQARHAKL